MTNFLQQSRQMLVLMIAQVFKHDPTIVSEGIAVALGLRAADSQQLN